MKDYFGGPIKKLGFGFMRLPMLGGVENEIDIEQVKAMVDLFMERGYSYYDTAFVYNNGKSEEAIRAAVTERYPRDAFQAATKIPLWRPVDFTQMMALADTSLQRMGLDFFDVYLLHGVGPDRLEMIDGMKAWEFLAGLQDSGKAKRIGFSYHGDADGLNRVLDAHADEIDLVQLQINYLDWEDEQVQSRRCYEAALDHGMGIIIMEPIKGGSLANFTPEVAEIFMQADPQASVASWALRFALGLEGVVNVLSGMSSLEQAKDNIKIAEAMKPLSEAELAVIATAMEEMKKIPTIPCTACRYCVDDCPEKINIPRIIEIMNDFSKYQNLPGAKNSYRMATYGAGVFGGAPAAVASDCTQCGSCELHCPQKIAIIDNLKEAVLLLE